MKGLPWVQQPSDVALNETFEKLSDAAFRTFWELVGLSQYELSDGLLHLPRVKKSCNSPRLRSALLELSSALLIDVQGDSLRILNPEQFMTMAAQVEAQRAEWRTKNNRKRGANISRISAASMTLDVSSSDECLNDSALSAGSEPVDSGGHSEVTLGVTLPLEVRGLELIKTFTQLVVAEAAETAKSEAMTLEKGWLARLGKEAKKLLEAGADVEQLKGAARLVVRENCAPSNLPYKLRDIQKGGKRGRSDGGDWL
jgi:hypothetical protein